MNIGTPEAPDEESVGAYLKHFLMDKDVISIPWPLRWILVNLLIVPRRKKSSASKYKKIWTPRGSPLRYFTEDLIDQLANQHPQFTWKMVMRYSEPQMKDVLRELSDQGCTRVILVPMFPQYADATVASSVANMREHMNAFPKIKSWQVFPEFYDRDFFIKSTQKLIARKVDALQDFDPEQTKKHHYLFSFHGLPVSQIKKNPGCLSRENCCEVETSENRSCYRRQCLATAKSLAKSLGLSSSQWSYSFQSRLGPTEWIKPYTEVVATELAKTNPHLVVHCPAFTIDCLETLEEINIELRQTFTSEGGKSFYLTPCLNADEVWSQAFGHALAEFAK